MMKNFSWIERKQNLEKLNKNYFDIVIIGGGINGAGVARDAASRGLKVALVEASDFAEGTSSRSSKLIHGGIRYLENMEFKLVYEALNERNKLFEIAPHLSHPLRFMIPLFEDSRVGMFKMGLGMWLYDALSLFQAPQLHERLSAQDTLRRMPQLSSNKLRGSYIYSDAYMDDDRLVHETLRSAHEWGATIANYVSADSIEMNEENRIKTILCTDHLTQSTVKIRGKYFISTVGPWTDLFGLKIFKDWKSILRPTKGVHLTFSKDRLPLSSAVVMGAEKSDRIVFGIPRHDMVIVGTTDTDFEGNPAEVRVEQEDVEYLLKVIGEYFPGAKIGKADILSSYAGVRPLVNDGSSSEGKVSREHALLKDQRGILFVTGGKYTTYRLISEQVVDAALTEFSLEDRVQFQRTQTHQSLNPYVSVENWSLAQSNCDLWAQKTLRPLPECQLLAERYGLEAEEFIFLAENLDLTYPQLEAKIAIEKTMCLHIKDFYTRRVPFFLAAPDQGRSYLDQVAQVFQSLLKWDDRKTQEEKNCYLSFIDKAFLWKSESSSPTN
jgi:glycerol-3-phosphate dehydrogenase